MNLQFVIDVVIVIACYHLIINAIKCLLEALLNKLADDISVEETDHAELFSDDSGSL